MAENSRGCEALEFSSVFRLVKYNGRTNLGIVGVALALCVSVTYGITGFKPLMPWLLLEAVVVVAFSLRSSPGARRWVAPARDDLLAVATLLLVMAPLYWWRLYSTPWQVNTDEVTIMLFARRMLAAPATDIFGVSSYFGFPSAVFAFVGQLADWLGGIGLLNSRIVHSTLGVGSALLAFAFFREFMSSFRAWTFAVILGANHALFAISRMAMRENSGLFLELLTLWLVARGIRRRSKPAILLGGATGGLAFYAYFPARIVVVIVVSMFICIAVLNAGRERLKLVGAYAGIFLLGWAMVAGPVMIASRADSSAAFGYARQQFLFYPEGRKLAQEWTGEKTPMDAWRKNIRDGLTTFNSRRHDQGFIYPNYNHGFVDPATGVLLWLGFLLAAVRLFRNRGNLLSTTEGGVVALGDLTALIGFLGIYLSCALLITKAPNYTRLLVVLPFVSYFAGTALWKLAEWLARGRSIVRSTIAGSAVAALAVWNVVIFNDFAAIGRREGDAVGSTARYVEARKHTPGYTWVLAADKANPYFTWGDDWQWKDWVGFFAGPTQTTRVVAVAGLSSLAVPGDYTIFISNAAWQSSEPAFRLQHPLYQVIWLTPTSRLLAVEVRSAQ